MENRFARFHKKGRLKETDFETYSKRCPVAVEFMKTAGFIWRLAKAARATSLRQLLLVTILAFAAISVQPPPALSSSVPILSNQEREKAAAFYKGKKIHWITYTDPGSSTDIMLRIFHKYLSQYIPGNPSMGVTEYMRGGGGTQEARFLNERAPRDGTMVGQVLTGSVRLQALGHESAQYDARKFNWVANYMQQSDWLFVTRDVIGLDTIKDLLQAKKINMGVQEVGHVMYDVMRLGAYFLGLRLNIIPGYSTGEMALAMERGELDGRVESSMTFVKLYREALNTRKLKIHWSSHPTKFVLVPEVPTALEVFEKYANPPMSEFERKVLKFFWASTRWSRPFAMPPGVPRERVLAIREGVYRTTQNPQFRAEFEKMTGSLVEYDDGEVLQKDFSEILGADKSVVDFYKVLNRPKPLPSRR